VTFSHVDPKDSLTLDHDAGHTFDLTSLAPGTIFPAP
jgi:hypothetical protein